MKPSFRVFLALTLLLCSCATLMNLSRSFQKPTLSFKSVALSDVSLGGLSLNLTYVLDNPNPLGLSLAEIDYALFVEGHQVVAGKPQKGLEIPASGKRDLVFPANVKFEELAPALATFLTKDVATYRAQGHVGVETPIGLVRIPLSREATFEVPKVPTLSFGTPTVRSLSLQGATVDFPLTLVNRSGYRLPLGSLGGNLSISGSPVGRLATGEVGTLEPKGAKSMTVPFEVSFLGAAAAANALRSGSGLVTFSGELRSGPVTLPLNYSETLRFSK